MRGSQAEFLNSFYLLSLSERTYPNFTGEVSKRIMCWQGNFTRHLNSYSKLELKRKNTFLLSTTGDIQKAEDPCLHFKGATPAVSKDTHTHTLNTKSDIFLHHEFPTIFLLSTCMSQGIIISVEIRNYKTVEIIQKSFSDWSAPGSTSTKSSQLKIQPLHSSTDTITSCH